MVISAPNVVILNIAQAFINTSGSAPSVIIYNLQPLGCCRFGSQIKEFMVSHINSKAHVRMDKWNGHKGMDKFFPHLIREKAEPKVGRTMPQKFRPDVPLNHVI